ncbi:effector binding domain-containing protein [Radiobacillus kanasensis]|uniref:GyrI-like domain-containing protein n=1 Tax=Radiobacillus kanasensis TaxID=2844358 RepID=UPI001E373991|nr:effector binding domain-containing protein [Radiobacillus kanasensis]UFT98411.1 effector binding domain-containing protein [Radiobacillus kanasensis]
MKMYMINSIRTNNFSDKEIMEKIQTMWEESSSKLENYNGIVYGIYFDYESDYKGDYSLSVAIEDDHGDSLVEIPNDEKYEVFKVDATNEQGIIKTWNKIWQLEEAGSLDRVYSYDFEKYYSNGEIEIHIAIK